MNQARALSALCLLGMGALVGACSGGDETRIEGDASREVLDEIVRHANLYSPVANSMRNPIAFAIDLA